MDMVRSPADGKCFHSVFTSDSTKVRPKPRFQVGIDERRSILRTKDAVQKVTDIGMRHESSPFSRPRCGLGRKLRRSQRLSAGLLSSVRFADSESRPSKVAICDLEQ